jgi:hypothetical protein
MHRHGTQLGRSDWFQFEENADPETARKFLHDLIIIPFMVVLDALKLEKLSEFVHRHTCARGWCCTRF